MRGFRSNGRLCSKECLRLLCKANKTNKLEMHCCRRVADAVVLAVVLSCADIRDHADQTAWGHLEKSLSGKRKECGDYG